MQIRMFETRGAPPIRPRTAPATNASPATMTHGLEYACGNAFLCLAERFSCRRLAEGLVDVYRAEKFYDEHMDRLRQVPAHRRAHPSATHRVVPACGEHASSVHLFASRLTLASPAAVCVAPATNPGDERLLASKFQEGGTPRSAHATPPQLRRILWLPHSAAMM
jgi:hypothetical protein